MASNFQYHGTNTPCPLCGGKTDCRTNLAGGIHCRRADKENPPAGWSFRRVDSHGFGVFVNETGSGHFAGWATRRAKISDELKKGKKGKSRPVSTAFDRIGREKRAMSEKERDAIATQLKLPLGIFDLLEVAFLEDDSYGRPAFVFPEKFADGKLAGFTLRYCDGKKRNHGNRGLSIPAGWDTNDPGGPIFLVEGASDTLACMSMNLNVIGRPSNTGGVEELSKLLQTVDESRPIIVVGENDRKDDGTWPGFDGADRTAQKLAKALGRAVHVALPAAGSKDSRSIIEANWQNVKAGKVTLRILGQRFRDHCLATATARNFVLEAETVSIGPVATSGPLQDWTARDFSPPPSPSTYTPPARCTSQRCVTLHHDEKRKSRVCWVDCKRLACPECGPKRRSQYQASVDHHLRRHGANVFSFWCPELEWETVSRGIRDDEANYFRLNNSSGNYLVVATSPPKSNKLEADEIPFDAAIRRLNLAIDMLPKFTDKALTYSRPWKLIGEDKPAGAQGWKRIGKVSSCPRAIFDILEYHKVDWKPVSHQGVYWYWQAWEWDDAGTDRDRIFGDIQAGEILPVDFKVAGWDDANGEDEWAGGDLVGCGVGPPGEVFIDW